MAAIFFNISFDGAAAGGRRRQIFNDLIQGAIGRGGIALPDLAIAARGFGGAFLGQGADRAFFDRGDRNFANARARGRRRSGRCSSGRCRRHDLALGILERTGEDLGYVLHAQRAQDELGRGISAEYYYKPHDRTNQNFFPLVNHARIPGRGKPQKPAVNDHEEHDRAREAEDELGNGVADDEKIGDLALAAGAARRGDARQKSAERFVSTGIANVYRFFGRGRGHGRERNEADRCGDQCG